MLGADMVERFRIVQNNAFDAATQVSLGLTSHGHEIWVNRELMDCTVKILTGFIEPHLFAGFSGGGKALMPGMCGLTTVLGNHGWKHLAHPQATWGVTHGNPLWEEIQEIAIRAGASFLINVTLNRKSKLRVSLLEICARRTQGCDFVRRTAMVEVGAAFDIVVTTNSGYPLDLNSINL
jgi:nickel-dependent lactate racemase